MYKHHYVLLKERNSWHVQLVPLYSDICAEQNKNMNLLTALSFLNTGILVQHHHAVRGHSYMPSDKYLDK